MSSPARPRTGMSMRVVHGVIAGGCLLVVVALVVVMGARGGPMLSDAGSSLPAYLTAAISLAALLAAVLVIRPRLEEPSAAASRDYWTPAHRFRAILLWGVLDTGITVGAVGHFLTGDYAPMIAAGLALAALFWYSPGRLSGE